jgi:hypothetical protein
MKLRTGYMWVDPKPTGDPVVPIKPVRPPPIDQCKEMEKMAGKGKDYRGA